MVSPTAAGAPNTANPNAAVDFTGALDNEAGSNSWEQTVTFWSSVNNMLNLSAYYDVAITIGAAKNTSLTIDGVITQASDIPMPEPFADAYSFSKVGNGRVILTNANTFSSFTDVLQGALNLRDSGALGTPPGILKKFGAGGPEAWFGASIELQSDSIPDSVPLASKLPGQTQYDLTFPKTTPIFINGAGVNNEGALANISGSNRIEGPIVMRTSATIGVAADGDPNNVRGVTASDLSQLTLDGVIKDGITAGLAPFATRANLTKVGLGELVLTSANTYLGPSNGEGSSQTYLDEGWITMQNNQALGGQYAVLAPDVQPGITVADGAALVLKKDSAGNNINLAYNIALAGTGINNPHPWLNQDGALLSL
jgi:autotransporter-associated beta strand protein